MPHLPQSTVAVACIGDDNVAMPMAVSLFSAVTNLDKNTALSLSLFDAGMSEANRRKINSVLLATGRDVQIKWIEADSAQFASLSTNAWVNKAVYIKLAIPEHVPAGLDKILYLDSDIIVLTSLHRLWEQDTGGYRVLAARDYRVATISAPLGLAADTSRALGLHPETPYFNAGILVLNLKKWREEDLSVKVLDYMQAYKETIRLDEQEGMNAVIGGHWGELDPRWNAQVGAVRSYASWEPSAFRDSLRGKIGEVRKNPYILHYAGASKPWNDGLFNYARPYFTDYLRRSGWFTPREYQRWWAGWLGNLAARKWRALAGRLP